MGTCAYCKAKETHLYRSGAPVCLRCANAPQVKRKPPATQQEIGAALLQEMLSAVALNEEAANEFDRAASQSASTGVRHPDGAQRIKGASGRLSAARKDVMAAHQRLSEFVERGIVPEDLKRTG